MSKPIPPTRPKPAWTPSTSESMSHHTPKETRLRIEDLSPLADPLGRPMLGAMAGQEDNILCDTCKKCWRMSIAGQFKNKKSDGSEYILTERFCVFKDSLVSLAERAVRDCSRYELKTIEGDDK